ncbi:MAG: triose-phosphate isomerase [Bdellovibrionales bacterium]|nr:triose-phosphate isomerase [Bdellovibrionales bacterium]
MKSFLVAANWKMNKTLSEAESFLKELKEKVSSSSNAKALIFPSAISLSSCQKILGESAIAYGAQNCHFEDSGAFTGEISPLMLKDVGATHALVGHSERRHVFGETDAMMSKKVAALVKHNICPVLCVGEKEDERVAQQTLGRIRLQLDMGLSLVDSAANVIIAYEPVWAIGTGRVPSLDDIKEVHSFIRSELFKKWGDRGNTVPILYGGSVTPQNSKDISTVQDVGGFLIGGASLKIASYLDIYNSL